MDHRRRGGDEQDLEQRGPDHDPVGAFGDRRREEGPVHRVISRAMSRAVVFAVSSCVTSLPPRITAMREMIDDLVANGCAYVAEDHVLFHVAAMPDYGRLSGRSLDEMIAGVEVLPAVARPSLRKMTRFWRSSSGLIR